MAKIKIPKAGTPGKRGPKHRNTKGVNPAEMGESMVQRRKQEARRG